MRSERIVAAVIVASGLTFGAGCSQPDSFIILSLESTSTSIDNVAQIEVQVTGLARPLYYDAHGMSINRTDQRTLSVGFPHDRTGSIEFTVDALTNLGCSIGHGKATQEIKKGNTAMVPVALTPMSCSNVDGGAPEVPPGVTLPGCDPVNPQIAPDGGVACADTQTCLVCTTPADAGVQQNVCSRGGTAGPGMTCVGNADCMPGTQCFNYKTLGCDLRLCLRFCNGNAECAAFGATGNGPGSVCEGPVMCPDFLTAYHTCTVNCDPRAAAAANGGGCPTGLACVMPASMDKVDCACAESTRTKLEGQACTQAADCAPGLICNLMSNTKICRSICRCDANAAGNCVATANDCPKAGTTCHAVTNNTIYGVCL